MSKLLKKRKIQFSLIISVLLHGLILVLPAQRPALFDFDFYKENQQKPFKVHSLRTVGKKDSKIKSVYLKDKKKITRKKKTNTLTAKELAPKFNDFDDIKKEQNNTAKNIDQKDLSRPKAIKALSLNKKSINNFLKGTPNSRNSKKFQQALDKTDNLVKLEVPEGVKEDELNKHELVFYSFQKRTALNYINSFYKKLNEFELQNPHLKFPLTENKQTMVGRVVYDKNGNIVRINMLKWSNVNKLQGFFLNVLQEMTSLPNPPDQILQNDQFTVFYSLTVND